MTRKPRKRTAWIVAMDDEEIKGYRLVWVKWSKPKRIAKADVLWKVIMTEVLR